MRESETRQNAMRDCKEQASTEFVTELSLVKQLDKIYSEILQRAVPIQQLNFHQLANCGLAVKSYRSLHYAIDALENGYYEVAMTLLRSVFENRLQMMYFARFPDQAKVWLMNGKKIEQAKIREKLGLGIEEKDTYDVLSKNYAHPLLLESLIPIIYDTENNHEFHQYPYYIPNECRLSVGCWISFAKDTIRLLIGVFKPQQLGDGSWARTVMQVLETANQCAIEIAHDLGKEAERFTEDDNNSGTTTTASTAE